jgi:SOS-response transcriptional repressor LexA
MPVLPYFQDVEAWGPAMTENLAELARFVSATRKAKGLTLEQVTERGGPSVSWLSLLETGKMLDRPKVETLRRLSVALGVSLSRLLEIVGYGDLLPKSASSQAGGNHGPAMVSGIVANGEYGQNHGAEPVFGENSVVSEGILGPGGQLDRNLTFVQLPIIGAAACGEPIEAIMDRATDVLSVELRRSKGAEAAMVIEGDSMTGAGLLPGDHVLVKLANGTRPASGKCVIVRTPDGLACKRFREDELGVYLEEHTAGQEVRRVKYDEAELVGIVVGLHRDM